MPLAVILAGYIIAVAASDDGKIDLGRHHIPVDGSLVMTHVDAEGCGRIRMVLGEDLHTVLLFFHTGTAHGAVLCSEGLRCHHQEEASNQQAADPTF